MGVTCSVALKPGIDERPSFFIAKFGSYSWAPQHPSDARDVYFEEIWLADANGQITGEFTEQRGLWLGLDEISMNSVHLPSGGAI